MNERRALLRWSGARVATTAWLVALLAATAVMLVPDAAQGAAAVTLNAPKAKVKPTSLVTFSGSAGAARGGKVSVQRRVGKSWKAIASGRTGAKGRFALTWITPSRASSVSVRAVLAGGRPSTVRSFKVLAPAKGAKRVIVSPKTRVISPSTVQSVPPAGQPGSVTYAGGNDAQKGQIVVIGKGVDTPNGFLGRVTDVSIKDGKTVVSTVPATLQQAVPEGAVHLTAANVTASAAGSQARAAAKVTCEGSVGASITHDVSFTAGLKLDINWTLTGGLQGASLTASAGLTASLKAALTAAGSCSLARITLLSLKGPSVSGFVGPVPVVLTSNLSVYLDATASAQAELSTGASAGFDASAGIAWTKGGGFAPIQSFTPHFSFDPPSLSASASVAANVTPTLDVLLYGIVGPQIALRTGVELAADPSLDPWWTLSVPVDLTAAIDIKPLGLTSPTLHVYQRSFTIADAGGPFGSSTPPPSGGVTNVATPPTSVAAGYDMSCGLRSSGAIACWGGDSKGQLGNGAPGASPAPVAVSGITDAAGIVAANDHVCALRIHGEVACWGDNSKAELGNGATGGTSTTPVAVKNTTNATAVAAGAEHSCALLASRRITCWGANDVHQFGDGGTTPSSAPVEVSGITNATAITSGYFHSCAVRAGGTVACWGRNGDGRLGNGSTAESAVPVTVSGITNATGVATGSNHACALLATGGVKCWGDNFYGQLGNGASPADSTVPVTVTGITDATSIEAGAAHTCARLSSGAVKCWGWNEYGALGDGTDVDRSTPVTVNNITNATGVTGGLEHTCVLRTGGGMACWGFGGDGELGNGGKATSFTPVAVTGFP